MTTTLTPEQTLLAYVVMPEATGCALMRIPTDLPPGNYNRLVRAAESIGFTRSEAYGIMAGWDNAPNRAWNLEDLEPSEWWRGFAIGERMRKSAGL